ncbi:MAG: aminotransferase class V-fold PLP-dependent enzyme [Holophagaceae bacterium]|nr:aminotransferase class V-fold PLP-dependent enzyme [Holophagaceae bacterium]
MQAAVCLDFNATTPCAPEVLEAMLPWFSERFGNAGSAHALGVLSDGAVVHARNEVAALLNASPAELAFNGCGTEGLNHAFRGAFEAFPAKRHFITTAVEHAAVHALVAWLRQHGAEITVLGVDGQGGLDLGELEAAIRPDTALVSVMAANNETGVCFPVAEIARIARAKGALVHCDATQAIGKLPVDVQAWGVDLLNLSAHKFHGPKGVGALYIRRGLRLKPFMVGGGQERGRRGGTENVPGLVGLGRAARLALERLPAMDRVRALRDRLEAACLDAIPEARVEGAAAPRLPNTSLLSFKGLEGEALLLRLDGAGFCVSTGSACATGQKEPSQVLRAMAVPADYARGTIRVSLGHPTSSDEVDGFIQALPRMVEALRALNPFER